MFALLKWFFGLLKWSFALLAKLAIGGVVAASLTALVLLKPFHSWYEVYKFDQEVQAVEQSTTLDPGKQMDLLEQNFRVCTTPRQGETTVQIAGFRLPDEVGKGAIEAFISQHTWSWDIRKRRTEAGEKYLVIFRW